MSSRITVVVLFVVTTLATGALRGDAPATDPARENAELHRKVAELEARVAQLEHRLDAVEQRQVTTRYFGSLTPTTGPAMPPILHFAPAAVPYYAPVTPTAPGEPRHMPEGSQERQFNGVPYYVIPLK